MKNKIQGAILLIFLLIILPIISVIILQTSLANIYIYVLLIFAVIISIWIFSHLFYLFILTLFGYKSVKKDYEMLEDETKFLILIPAHNEAEIISSTLENLANIDYDESLYQIVIINDNSEDNTSQIVRDSGMAQLIETDDFTYQNIGVGKPRALQYTFLSLLEAKQLTNYDLLLVLDADNYVDTNILKELNSQYIQKNKPEAIQVYLDSKNIQNLLSLGYATSYWTMNRFYQLAKYRIGLPNSIGGTGFCVKVDWLINNEGFSSTSLTEDLEMEIRIIETGGMILWNHFARVYDEKPTQLKASLIQRYRWSRGHWYVAFTYVGRMFSCFLKDPKFKYIDQIIYLFSMNLNFQALIMIAIFITWLIQLLCNLDLMNNLMLHWSASYVLMKTFLNYFVFFYGFVPVCFSVLADRNNWPKEFRKKVWQLIRINISFLYFSFTYGFCQIWGLFTFGDQETWAKTKHEVNTLREDVALIEEIPEFD